MFVTSLEISFGSLFSSADAATASGALYSEIPSAFASSTACVFSEIFSSTNVCASRLESAFSLLAISFSISAISLSVKSASFKDCFWSSVSVKASFSSTTASLFSVLVSSAGASSAGVFSGSSSFDSTAGASSSTFSVISGSSSSLVSVPPPYNFGYLEHFLLFLVHQHYLLLVGLVPLLETILLQLFCLNYYFS